MSDSTREFEELEALWLTTRNEDYLSMPQLIEELPDDYELPRDHGSTMSSAEAKGVDGASFSHRDGVLQQIFTHRE